MMWVGLVAGTVVLVAVWGREHDQAVGRQQAFHLVEQRVGVREMLDELEADDQVERAISERDARRGCRQELDPAVGVALPRMCDGFLGRVEADDTATARRQQGAAIPLAASEVQNPALAGQLRGEPIAVHVIVVDIRTAGARDVSLARKVQHLVCPGWSHRPLMLSIVVVVHDMARQAPRTLLSLSRAYQRGIAELEYEVLVVDNDSHEPVDPEAVRELGPEFRLDVHHEAGRSPLTAVNEAVAQTTGERIAVVLDGACLLTPGVLELATGALDTWPGAFVTTYAWQLGDQLQNVSVTQGYDPDVEKTLLAQIGWPDDGYALFDRAMLDQSNPDGWFGPIAECRFFMTDRQVWERLGGYDEDFTAPGGGLGGLDLFERLCALQTVPVVGLLGEGSFHQVHGGVSSNSPVDRWDEMHAEYVALRGRPWDLPLPDIAWLGRPGASAGVWLARSAGAAQRDALIDAAPPLVGATALRSPAGFHADRWVEASATCRIRVTRDATAVEVLGWTRETAEATDQRLAVSVGQQTTEEMLMPGPFAVVLDGRFDAGDVVELRVEHTGPSQAGGAADQESRDLRWRVHEIRFRNDGIDPRTTLPVDGGRTTQTLGGRYADGWMTRSASCELQADHETTELLIEGWMPGEVGQASGIAVEIDGGAPAAHLVAAGMFSVSVPLMLAAGERARVRVTSDGRLPEDMQSPGEPRDLAWLYRRMALR